MLRLALITDKENQTYIESLQIAVEIKICWSINNILQWLFTYKIPKVKIFDALLTNRKYTKYAI